MDDIKKDNSYHKTKRVKIEKHRGLKCEDLPNGRIQNIRQRSAIRATNQEVLWLTKLDCQLLRTVKRRKLAYVGHVIRGEKYFLLQITIKGKTEGKRVVGRREWLGTTVKTNGQV
ncbi:hypothetical protein J437_LFUL011307 [Ladona fulva]|uniref:Uncharacterized protein n=1 Tax=Ladona fulva TaxID=123851 RepID=A0A8K0KD34_LADFU|nr:hypothetical protein J437_LFUL011307 [Ladona fulva]